MKALRKALNIAFILPALAVGMLMFATPVAAADDTDCSDVTSGGIGKGAECAKPDTAPSQLFGKNSIFTTVTSILLFIIGAIAVIMLIVGGIKYVVSQGDQTSITNAKNTILYAIIGIVVAFLAYAAVGFVTDQLNKGTDESAATHSRVA